MSSVFLWFTWEQQTLKCIKWYCWIQENIFSESFKGNPYILDRIARKQSKYEKIK